MQAPAAMEVVRAAVARGEVPCAVAAVCGTDGDAALEAFGNLCPGGPPANTGTRFDLASLTKLVATTTLLLRLQERGMLNLAQPAGRYLPAFAGPERRGITLLQLATHTAGLPAVHDFTQCKSMAAAAGTMGDIPLAHAPGARVLYSDLGFIALGAVLESVANEDFAALFAREVAAPLGLAHTGFCPTGGNIACTERDAATGQLICGLVHDENARAFGGVSGHAGLFAPAGDLCRFAAMLLTGRAPDGAPYLKPETLARMRQNHTAGLPGQGRGIGWMVNQPPAAETPPNENAAGEAMGREAFGHTGFTGTSLWVEPVRGLACILLTNRVCPTRANTHIFPLRRAFHNAALG